MMGIGQIHWRANGMRYPHCVVFFISPVRMPVDKRPPMTQHMLIHEVMYPLRCVGQRSAAYEIASVWKTPQGRPWIMPPTRNISSPVEKNGMKMAPVMNNMLPIIVFLYPIHSVM